MVNYHSSKTIWQIPTGESSSGSLRFYSPKISVSYQIVIVKSHTNCTIILATAEAIAEAIAEVIAELRIVPNQLLPSTQQYSTIVQIYKIYQNLKSLGKTKVHDQT